MLNVYIRLPSILPSQITHVQRFHGFPRKSIQTCCIRQASTSRSQYNKKNQANRPRAYVLLVIPIATFGLGVWQIQRRKWKLGLIQDLQERTTAPPIPFPEDLDELDPLEYRRVSVCGTFDHSREISLGPRGNLLAEENGRGMMSKGQGTSGSYIITPFTLADRDVTILVNRGWVPRNQVQPQTRPQGQVAGEVNLVGVVRRTEKRPQFGIANNPAKGVWFHRDVDVMAELLGTAPIFLDAVKSSSVPGGPVGGQTRVSLRNEHLSYIITWFSLSAITSFMWYRRYVR